MIPELAGSYKLAAPGPAAQIAAFKSAIKEGRFPAQPRMSLSPKEAA
jgi:hypothetical protein